jgi:post-segregation antitoxin (ccd killing protein)
MRAPLYNLGARRRTVSLTLNADLCAKAKAAGINLSRIAEEALANALAARVAEQMKAEIRRDLDGHAAFVREHGSFADMVREHYAADADA